MPNALTAVFHFSTASVNDKNTRNNQIVYFESQILSFVTSMLTLNNGTKQDIYWSIYNQNNEKMFQFKKLEDNDKAKNVKEGYRLQVQQIGDTNFVLRSPLNLSEGKTGYISYTFSIRCIESSYKYSFTDLEHSALTPGGATGGPLEAETASSGGASFPRLYWNNVKAESYYKLQQRIEQLKEWMKKHSTEDAAVKS